MLTSTNTFVAVYIGGASSGVFGGAHFEFANLRFNFVDVHDASCGFVHFTASWFAYASAGAIVQGMNNYLSNYSCLIACSNGLALLSPLVASS